MKCWLQKKMKKAAIKKSVMNKIFEFTELIYFYGLLENINLVFSFLGERKAWT